MKIIEEKYTNLSIPKELEQYACPEKILFFDIETTGLKKETTSLYLIGCGYYKNSYLHTIFFFGESPDEELQVIEAFFDYITQFECLIHFNGTKFDIPYLEYKANKYNINNPINSLKNVDLYKEIKPLRYLIFRESMRQKSVEDFLQIKRNDIYNGGELIEVYKQYVINRDEESFNLLMMHNREDILGMHKISPILNYLDLDKANINFVQQKILEYKDLSDKTHNEIILEYNYSRMLPKTFSVMCNDIYYKFDAEHNMLIIRIKLPDYDMYHYYDNYKDYYYLPSEEICIHKSIASSVDKTERIKATKDNCRVKVNGLILPQFTLFADIPCGKDYSSRYKYFVLEKSSDNTILNQYGMHLLETMVNSKPKRKKQKIE